MWMTGWGECAARGAGGRQSPLRPALHLARPFQRPAQGRGLPGVDVDLEPVMVLLHHEAAPEPGQALQGRTAVRADAHDRVDAAPVGFTAGGEAGRQSHGRAEHVGDRPEGVRTVGKPAEEPLHEQEEPERAGVDDPRRLEDREGFGRGADRLFEGFQEAGEPVRRWGRRIARSTAAVRRARSASCRAWGRRSPPRPGPGRPGRPRACPRRDPRPMKPAKNAAAMFPELPVAEASSRGSTVPGSGSTRCSGARLITRLRPVSASATG